MQKIWLCALAGLSYNGPYRIFALCMAIVRKELPDEMGDVLGDDI